VTSWSAKCLIVRNERSGMSTDLQSVALSLSLSVYVCACTSSFNFLAMSLVSTKPTASSIVHM